MQTLFKKPFPKPIPANAKIKRIRGNDFAVWVGKGGKERKAPIAIKPDGSQAIRLDRKTWVARYRNSDGIIVERSTKCTTKAAANAVLSDFVKEAERISAGVITKDETEIADWRHSSLTKAIEDYSLYQTRRGNAQKRVKFTKAYLLKDSKACSWRTLKDLDSDRLQRHLDDLQTDGKGAGVLNQHVASWRAFGNWLAGKRIKGKRAHWKGNKRLASNPFEGFGRYDEKADCRRKRRALSESEISRLLAAAAERPLDDARTIRTGPKKGQMTATVAPDRVQLLKRQGQERVLIYKTLILTGLRKNELASITLKQCRLDGDLPFIDLHASDEKNGQGNNIPIPSDLAEELMAWIADRHKQLTEVLTIKLKPSPIEDEPLFDVPTGLVRILNRDLAAAGIPKVDKFGRSIDVHALRHTFATLLSNSGVAPRVAQAVMRHSDLRLTMNTYTDQSQLDIYGALNKLPLLNSPIESEANQATGTKDKHTNDSEVVSLVSLISDNPPALRTFQDVKTDAEHSSRLVSPMVSPQTCPKETIQDNCSGLGKLSAEKAKQEKPQENTCFPELSSVGLTGFEPATSTPPVKTCFLTHQVIPLLYEKTTSLGNCI